MEIYVKLFAQILFAVACFVFALYSIMGMYALNNYGRSKNLTLSINIAYSAVVICLMVWGWLILSSLE